MEPDPRFFKPFIKPLLELPGSTYRHTNLKGADDYPFSQSYAELFADETLIEKRSDLAKNDPQLKMLDPSFLVIGNLARAHRTRKGLVFGGKYASSVVTKMANGALENVFMHRYGLMRMLWWVPDDEKQSMLAYWESSKTAFNSHLNMGTALTEVAGCTPLWHQKSETSIRPPFMEVAAEKRVQKSMDTLGMRLPEGRLPNIATKSPSKIGSIEAGEVKFVSPLQTSTKTLAQLRGLIEISEARLTRLKTWPNRLKTEPKPKELAWAMETIEYPQCIPCTMHHAETTAKRGRPDRLAISLDLLLRVVALEANYKAIEEKRKKHEKLKPLEARIRALDEEVWALLALRGDQYTGFLADILNEQITFFSEPRVLPRDSRQFEAFQIKKDEFWPPSEVSLIDMTPSGRAMAVPGLADASGVVKVCVELSKYLFSNRRYSVPAALDRLSPNAAQDLLPLAPSITDPRKGGRMNPHRMSVVMLTQEMIHELGNAFIEWPFKPDFIELVLTNHDVANMRQAEKDAAEMEKKEEAE